MFFGSNTVEAQVTYQLQIIQKRVLRLRGTKIVRHSAQDEKLNRIRKRLFHAAKIEKPGDKQ